MPYEMKPGQFALFKNDKQGNAKRPDYRGDGIDLSGNKIRVSAWLKEGKRGKFMSCNFQLAEERAPEPRTETRSVQPAPAGGGFDDMPDDIPF